MEKNVLTPEEIRAILSWEPLPRVEEKEENGVRSVGRDEASPPERVEEEDRENGVGRSRRRKHAIPGMKKVGFFQDVLNAMGEAIITTDQNGRILFQNAAAKTLLGQSSGKIWKKPFGIVVCLLDKTNREKLESPVDRCLAEGSQIPLLPHTILCRPDGSSIAIAGKVSPVFHPKGWMEGALVSFHIERSMGKITGVSEIRPVHGGASRTSGIGV